MLAPRLGRRELAAQRRDRLGLLALPALLRRSLLAHRAEHARHRGEIAPQEWDRIGRRRRNGLGRRLRRRDEQSAERRHRLRERGEGLRGDERLDHAALEDAELRPREEHAEPMGVGEGRVRMGLADLLPEPVHPEVGPVGHADVVQQHHAAIRQPIAPGVEVVPHRLVGVEAVDVQQVDRTGLEPRHGVVEGRTHELEAVGVVGLRDARDRREDLLAVAAAVLVALPRVDAEHLAGMPVGAKLRRRLRKGEERVSGVHAEFDDATRPPARHQPEHERQVPGEREGMDHPPRHERGIDPRDRSIGLLSLEARHRRGG